MPVPLLFATALLTSMIGRDETATIKPAFVAGTEHKYSFDMRMSVLGNEVSLKANPTRKVKSSASDAIVLEYSFKNVKLTIGDNEQDSPIENLVVKLSGTSELKDVTGGIEQVSPIDLYLILHFMTPQGEVKSGETFTKKFEKAGGMPAYTYTRTFEAAETVEGQQTYRFASTVAVDGKDALQTTNKVWITADGTIVKLKANFKNWDIPPAGGPQQGTISLTLSSK
jgi:hypothetical protein